MVITYREFIKDIAATTAFVKQDFPLNPGLSLAFPWLSQMADSYEEYKFKALVFEFKTTTSDSVVSASGNLGLGSVVMATNYNPNREPFVDKRTMEGYEGCSSKKPSLSNYHVVDIKKGTNAGGGLKWLRHGGILPNEDKRLYDVGTFSLATVGVPEGTVVGQPGVIGELWVAYSIEFFKPKYQGSTGASLLTDHYNITNAMAAGIFAIASPFGRFGGVAASGTISPNALNGINTWLSKSAAGNDGYNVLNFGAEQQGKTFMIFYCLNGTAFGGVAQARLQVTGGAVVYNNIGTAATSFMNKTSSVVRTQLANTNDAIFCCIVVQILNDDAGPWNLQWELSSAVVPTNPFLDLYVQQINGTPQLGPF